jgi:hypothetical protein
MRLPFFLCELAALWSVGACCSTGSIHQPNQIGTACDALSPAPSRVTDPDPGHARTEAVISGTLLSRALPGSVQSSTDELVLVMVKQDPHTTEEAVYITRTVPRPTPPEYKVVHARSKVRLSARDEPGGADLNEVAIDAGLVQALEQSWGSFTLRARWPDRKSSISMMKFGGTTYTFDYAGDNVYGQGYTISPERGTCTAALAELGELLTQFADQRDETKRTSIRAELLRSSQRLSDRLRGQ